MRLKRLGRPADQCLMRLDHRDERGDIVVGWLTRIALLLSAVGIAGYDGISVVTARTTAADHATTAAGAGADAWAAHHDPRLVGLAVAQSAASTGDTVAADSPTIDADGTVHARLCREATTLLLQRTSTTRRWTHQCASGQARTTG